MYIYYSNACKYIILLSITTLVFEIVTNINKSTTRMKCPTFTIWWKFFDLFTFLCVLTIVWKSLNPCLNQNLDQSGKQWWFFVSRSIIISMYIIYALVGFHVMDNVLDFLSERNNMQKQNARNYFKLKILRIRLVWNEIEPTS